MENVECPKCLGQQDYFNGVKMIVCTMCKGMGKVSEKIADMYDPISDELSNFKIEEEE